MARKILKKNNERFIRAACERLEQLGAAKQEDIPHSTMIDYVLQTPLGEMNVHVATDNIGCYTVFGRFDDVGLAKQHLDCNPHSGKYNLHVGGPKNDVADVIQQMYYWLDVVMGVEV